jgi:hypothetical protein
LRKARKAERKRAKAAKNSWRRLMSISPVITALG